MASFAGNLISAYQAGVAERRKREEEMRQAEDRKIQQEILAHQLKTMKLEDKVKAQQEAMNRAKALEGTPSPRIDMPLPTPVPQFDVFGKETGIDTATGTSSVPQPHAPVQIPGVYGPDYQIQPQSAEEITAQIIRQNQLKEMEQRQTNQQKIMEERAPVTVTLPDGRTVTVPGNAVNAAINQFGQQPSQPARRVSPELLRLEDVFGAETVSKMTPAQKIAALRQVEVGGSAPKREPMPGLSATQNAALGRQQARWDRIQASMGEMRFQEIALNQAIDSLNAGEVALASEPIIIAFEKMMDQNSVVREAEFNRPGEFQPLVNKLSNFYSRMKFGGPLPEKELREYAQFAKEVISKAMNSSNIEAMKSSIRKTLDANGLSHDLVFGEETSSQSAKPSGQWKVVP